MIRTTRPIFAPKTPTPRQILAGRIRFRPDLPLWRPELGADRRIFYGQPTKPRPSRWWRADAGC